MYILDYNFPCYAYSTFLVPKLKHGNAPLRLKTLIFPKGSGLKTSRGSGIDYYGKPVNTMIKTH